MAAKKIKKKRSELFTKEERAYALLVGKLTAVQNKDVEEKVRGYVI